MGRRVVRLVDIAMVVKKLLFERYEKMSRE
jgi:hypothetical protein